MEHTRAQDPAPAGVCPTCGRGAIVVTWTAPATTTRALVPPDVEGWSPTRGPWVHWDGARLVGPGEP